MSGSGYASLQTAGVPEIDHQRKALQERADDLVAADEVLCRFGKVCDLWVGHCRSEESLLERRDSPRRAVMKTEHERIRARVVGLKDQYAADPEAFRAGTAVGEIRRIAIRYAAQYDLPEFSDAPRNPDNLFFREPTILHSSAPGVGRPADNFVAADCWAAGYESEIPRFTCALGGTTRFAEYSVRPMIKSRMLINQN